MKQNPEKKAEKDGGNGKANVRVTEDQLLAQAQQIQQRKQTESTDRLRGLLQGSIPGANEFVGYLVEKARKAKQDWDTLQNGIRETEQRLEAMKSQAMFVRGQHDKYLDDLREWDGRAQAAEPEEEELRKGAET